MPKVACKAFPIENCTAWSYTTKVHFGTCKVDGMTIKMKFTVSLQVPTQLPDVLGIEAFVRKISKTPDTLEGYAGQLCAWLAEDVDVQLVGKGKTRTHGVITCVINKISP